MTKKLGEIKVKIVVENSDELQRILIDIKEKAETVFDSTKELEKSVDALKDFKMGVTTERH